jgi:hypothetical protein
LSYLGSAPLHGEADTHSEFMDDLAAAASVLAMAADSDSEDDMAQEIDAGELRGDLLESGTRQPNTANKENEASLPDSRALGAASEQVIPDYSNLHATPSDLSNTRCHLPIDQPSDAHVRRWQWLLCCCWLR